MKTSQRYLSVSILVICLAISGCTPGKFLGPTLTPLPTITPSSTTTPIPTLTSTPTQTSTPIPTSSVYVPVPRWMILGRPFYDVDILGENWKYTNDRWGETYGCIDYTREKEPYLFFEECFAYTTPDLTFDRQRDAFLKDGFETLIPNNTFGDVGQISLMAKRGEDNSIKFVKFLELIGIDNYLLLVEMNTATDSQDSLQSIYESIAADTIDYALKNLLEKSRLIPRPTATPLASNQQIFYDDLASKLITETQASEIYTATWVGEKEGSIDGTWESLGDRVLSNRTQVCRIFEDRTNVDVLWVGFENCIIAAIEFPFESLDQFCTEPGDAVLESNHKYKSDFLICAHDYTDFYAFLDSGEFIYAVSLESRKIGDYQDAFTQTVDDFIYNVLMINAGTEFSLDSEANTTPSNAGKILFQDDFSDSSQWGTGTDSDSSIEYQNKSLNMFVNTALWYTWSTPDTESFENVHIEVTVKNNSTDPSGAFGIMCNIQTNDTSYYFAVTGTGEYAIGRYTLTDDVFLTNGNEWGTSKAIPSRATSYQIGADCGNGTLTLYVDGQKIEVVKDSTFSSGMVGLFAWSGDELNGTNVSFDDFVVTSLK